MAVARYRVEPVAVRDLERHEGKRDAPADVETGHVDRAFGRRGDRARRRGDSILGQRELVDRLGLEHRLAVDPVGKLLVVHAGLALKAPVEAMAWQPGLALLREISA